MEWQVQGTLSVDSGTCAFADPADLPDGFEMPSTDASVIDLRDQAINLVACSTKEDFDIPVELAADGSGARLEFVNDVAELDGIWRQVARLDIRSGSCLACDPYLLKEAFYRVEFPLSNGSYVVEVFEFRADGEEFADILGFRIRRP